MYKELTDEIDLVSIGDEFVEKHEERKSIFRGFEIIGYFVTH